MKRGFVINRKSSCYKLVQKRCLIGLQKGVSKDLKEHVLDSTCVKIIYK